MSASPRGGQGSLVLLLHGGGGPFTVARWADQFAQVRAVRVITPTHPGFSGTDRPEALGSIRGLAEVYSALLAELDLTGVTVVGNSIGGWIAAELAILDPERVSRFVLVDAVGIDVPGHPVVDFFGLGPAEIAERSYFDPKTYGLDPATLSPEARVALAADRECLAVYGGTGMTDPTLAARLADIRIPTLVVWGEADRIGDPDFGRAYAAAIPGARFQLLTQAGHMPQIETPDKLIDAVWAFEHNRG